MHGNNEHDHDKQTPKDDINTEDNDELKLIIMPLVPCNKTDWKMVASKNIASSTRQNNIHAGLTI